MEHITRQSKIILSLLWLVNSYQKDKKSSMEATVTGASSDKVPTLTAGPNKKDAKSDFTEDVTIGYFGRLSYDFQKKYLFSATFREDASSRFATGNQWGFFSLVLPWAGLCLTNPLCKI